jgi:hypothetical protein
MTRMARKAKVRCWATALIGLLGTMTTIIPTQAVLIVTSDKGQGAQSQAALAELQEKLQGLRPAEKIDWIEEGKLTDRPASVYQKLARDGGASAIIFTNRETARAFGQFRERPRTASDIREVKLILVEDGAVRSADPELDSLIDGKYSLTDQRSLSEQKAAEEMVSYIVSPDSKSKFHIPPTLGEVKGENIVGRGREELQKIQREAGASQSIGLLTSYAVRHGQWGHPNPFGHTALRVGNKVLSINGQADASKGDHRFSVLPLEEYLYGTHAPEGTAAERLWFGDSYGEAYMRHVYEVSVVGHFQVDKLWEKWQEIEESFAQGEQACAFDAVSTNCVDFTRQLLRAAGIKVKGSSRRQGLARYGEIPMPVELLQEFRDHFVDKWHNRLENTLYQQVMESHATDRNGHRYSPSYFPVSIYAPATAMTRMLAPTVVPADPLETSLTQTVRIFQGANPVALNLKGTKPLALENSGEVTANLSDPSLKLKEQQERLYAQRKGLMDREKILEELMQELLALSPEKNHPEKFEQWLVSQKIFQNNYDSYTLAKLRYILDKVTSEFAQLPASLSGHISGAALKKIIAQVEKIQDSEKKYLAEQEKFGESKDYLRLQAFTQYFKTVAEAAKTLRESLRSSRIIRQLPKQDIPKDRSPSFLEKISHFFKISGQLQKLAHSSYIKLPAEKPGYTPHVIAIDKISKSLNELHGQKVEILGGENLQVSTPESNIVTIFASTHNSALQDREALAYLNLKDYLVVAAVDLFLPKTAAKRADLAPDIIAVGSKHPDAIKKMLASLAKNTSRNIMIHPQGALPVVNENLPNRDNFEKKLVKALLENGYQVRVIPLTLLMPPKFLDHLSLNQEARGNLRLVIDAAIEGPLIGDLLAKGKLNQYLRGLWLENIYKNTADRRGHAFSTLELEKVVSDWIHVDKFLLQLPELSAGVIPCTNKAFQSRWD